MSRILLILLAIGLSATPSLAQLQGGSLKEIKTEIEFFKPDSFLETTTWSGILKGKSINVAYLSLSNYDSLLSIEVLVDGQVERNPVEKGGIVAKYQGLVSPANLRNVPFERSLKDRNFEIHFSILRRNPQNSRLIDLGLENQSEKYLYSIKQGLDYDLVFQLHGDTTFFDSFNSDSLIGEDFKLYTFEANYPLDYFNQISCLPRYLPAMHIAGQYPEIEANYERLTSKLRGFFDLPRTKVDSFSAQLALKFEQSGADGDKAIALFRYLQKTYQNFEPGADWTLYKPGDIASFENRKILSSIELSLLYYTVLRELGVYTLLVASNPLASPFDLNFPYESGISYFSCAVNFDNAWHFIDFQSGTFISHAPNVNLQGKHYLIFDDQDHFYEQMPVSKPEFNIISGNTDIEQTEEGFQGKSTIKLTGLSQAELSEVLFGSNPKLVESVLENYFSGGSGTIKYSDFQHRYHGDTLLIEAQLKAGPELLVKHKGKYYLHPSFNIFPHSLPETADACTSESILSSYKNHNSFQTRIAFTHPLKLNQSYKLKLSEKGITYLYDVRQSSPNTLEFKYLFRNEHLYLPKSAVPIFNKGNKELSGIMYRPMVLELQ